MVEHKNPITQIGLNAHTGKPEAAEMVPAIIEALSQKGISVLLDQETGRLVPGHPTAADEDFAAAVDAIVVLGGDGSIIRALHRFGPVLPPIFGINLGSLGFLVAVQSVDWRQAIDCVASGNWDVSRRALLDVEIRSVDGEIKHRVGLNDVVISRGEFSRLIRLRTIVDGDALTEYHADGLIISSPTGSTAYALSAGGPVIAPESCVMLLTPICPHVLTNRAVIVPDRCLIEVQPVESGPEKMFVSVDGQQNFAVARGDVIRIRRAQQELPLATPPGTPFFQVLRHKLKWSGSALPE